MLVRDESWIPFDEKGALGMILRLVQDGWSAPEAIHLVEVVYGGTWHKHGNVIRFVQDVLELPPHEPSARVRFPKEYGWIEEDIDDAGGD